MDPDGNTLNLYTLSYYKTFFYIQLDITWKIQINPCDIIVIQLHNQI